MKFLYAALAVSIFTVISISSSNCLAEDESTEPTEQKEVLTASGTVIDSEGNPVPKATIACATWVNQKRKNILLKSDSDGKYKISYPNAKSIHQSLETWVWAKGHGVRTVMMKAKFLKGVTVAKDVTIELPPNETFDIKITDPNGDPFANAKVEVTMGHVPNGQFAADEPTGMLSFVPTAISRQLLSVTDNGGTATIEGFPRQLMDGVSVSSGEYGTQILAERER